MTVGIRELKNSLSEYVREVERGKRVSVTVHGRIVAELVPARRPGRTRQPARKLSRWEQMIADGKIQLAVEDGDPFEDDGIDFRLPKGTTLEWNEWDKEDDR